MIFFSGAKVTNSFKHVFARDGRVKGEKSICERLAFKKRSSKEFWLRNRLCHTIDIQSTIVRFLTPISLLKLCVSVRGNQRTLNNF